MNTLTPSQIVGIDLSLRSTGIAGAGNVIRVEPPKNLTGHDRLTYILDDVRLYTTGAELVVIEGLAFAAHDTSRQQAGLHWLVRHSLWRRDIPYAIVPPSTRIRYALGKGVGDKDRVLAAAIKRYPQYEITGNDEADAVILYAAGCRWAGCPIDDPMPATHTAALAKAEWPEHLDGAA